jgi:glucan 1,3-beta-glucosidase
MPLDPRIAIGTCPSIVAATDLTLVNNPFVGPYSAWQTGGSATVSPIAAAGIAAYTQWPPASLGPTPAEFLPTYTPTQAPITQRAASPTSFPAGYSTVLSMNNGWFNPRDTEPYNTPIQGCNYPNAYSGLSATIPRTHCPPRAPGAAPAAPTIVPARDAAVTTTTPELIATTRFPVITADAPRTTAASPTPVRTATT